MPTLAMILSFVVAIVVIVSIAQVLVAVFGKKADTAENAPADERVRQLTEENDALTRELEQVHDRLETLERIVTDKPSRLEAEIDALKSLDARRAPKE